MQAAPLADNEAQRLQTLRLYDILDTDPERAFDDITEVSTQILNTPISLVSLIDEDRQWFKSKYGLDAVETPRDQAFCAHAILQDDVFMVNNALDDPRFADNPLVAGSPDIRFYAGAPLIMADQSHIGTLCVIDRVPRTLDDESLKVLGVLRDAVVNALELRRLKETRETHDRLVHVCAWCSRIQRDDQEPECWISPDNFIRQNHSVSHTICAVCRDEIDIGG